MKKTITIILILIALGAGYFYSQSLEDKTEEQVIAQEENTENVVVNEKEENANSVGVSAEGDFDGDGKIENAVVVKVKEGTDNILDGENARSLYEIQFSNKNISNIKIDCCEAILINEGDLNNDKKDDISIYQAPLNGNTYIMQTFSFSNGKWSELVPAFLFPTYGEYPGDDALRDRIFKENQNIYYMDLDISGDSSALIKTLVQKF